MIIIFSYEFAEHGNKVSHQKIVEMSLYEIFKKYEYCSPLNTLFVVKFKSISEREQFYYEIKDLANSLREDRAGILKFVLSPSVASFSGFEGRLSDDSDWDTLKMLFS